MIQFCSDLLIFNNDCCIYVYFCCRNQTQRKKNKTNTIFIIWHYTQFRTFNVGPAERPDF